MKKILQYVLLCAFILNVAFMADAESDKGTWKIHTIFNENKKRVVDTGDKVYCLTDNSLNAYNKQSGKWEGLTKLDRLSDFFVKNIYYNPKKKYLVVTYNNFNIDILLENGETVNIPNLKDMTTVADKAINDVTFGQNCIYVASKMGFLVIDDKDYKVTKSALFNSNVQSIAEVGEYILLSNGSDLLYTNKSANIKSMNQFTSTGLGASGTILPINDRQFFLSGSLLYLVTIDNGTFHKNGVSQYKPIDVQATANGYVAFDSSKYYEFGKDCKKTADMVLPAELSGALITSQESDGSLWRLSKNGLKHVKLDVASSATTSLSEELIPNSLTAQRTAVITYNKHNKNLYVTNGSITSTDMINDYSKTARISSFDGRIWKNEVPTDMKGYAFQDPYEPVFDPNDPETFYVGTWFQGLYKITSGELIAKYDWNNSPFVKALNWYCNIPCVSFDTAGNLWTVQFSSGEREKEIAVLPKDKLSKKETAVEDWTIFDFPLLSRRGLNFYITSNNYKILFDGQYYGYLTVFTNDDNTFQTIKKKSMLKLTDQEGKKVQWDLIFDIEEDKNGVVWVAYKSGIFGFKPEEVFKQDFRVIKPRNKEDKSKFILDNIFCTCISVDEYNRKWVGTADAGFYLLNEDCTEVLKHFNIYNSCLPINKILSICWNPITKSVFVGVNGGLIEYKPEEYNAVESFKAEPNVVTPDFVGIVKFLNVPENAILSIKDSNGTIIRTIQPSGSKYYWNCLSDDNTNVKTGVYTVTAVVNGEEQQETVKVHVIK